MRFGISWVTDDPANYAELVRRTEEAGVDRLGVPDTQAAEYRECYVSLATALRNTTTMHAGPLVTNPVTRHPAVTAAALASAAELSGGRVTCCVATGDTGLLNLGLRPARLARLEAYVTCVRELLHRGTSTWQGDTVRLKWAGHHVPIYIAADGPKALRLAGRVADGVVVGTGLLPEVVRLVDRYVAEGAEQAGRDSGEVDVWYMARAAFTDERAEALRLVRPSLAAGAAHAFRFSLDGKAVPERYVDAVRELERRYDFTVHNVPGAENPNALLVEELGLTEYLAARLGVVGTHTEVVDQLRALRERGVRQLYLRPLVTDRQDFLTRLTAVIRETATVPA